MDEIKLEDGDIFEKQEKTKLIKEDESMTTLSKNQIKNTIQTKPTLLSQNQKNQIKNETKVQVLSFEDLN